MTETAIIYHNPRCSKSRNTLDILQEKGLEIQEVRYLDMPPSKQELKQLCELLDKKPIEITRTGESLFKELGLNKNDDRSDDEWLDILINNPKLIERPIVKINGKAVIGRPPENVLNIINS